MAIESSGMISMGGTAGTNRSILNEKQGSTTARTNVSLRGLSSDAHFDYGSTHIPGTPNSATPYAMTEFYGYSHFNWGSPGAVSPNTYLGNHDQEDRNGDDTDVVSTVEMTLTNSGTSGSISFRVRNTAGSGGFGGTDASSYATVTYSGTLSSLEARWVHTGLVLGNDSYLASTGKVFEIFSNSSMMDTYNVGNQTVTGATASGEITSTGTFNGGFSTLRTTSGSMSAAVAAASDSSNSPNGYSRGRAQWLSGSLKLQLRANGSEIVDLISNSGTIDIQAETQTQESTP
jgi:hypothetical protein